MIEFQKTYKSDASMPYIQDCLNNGSFAGEGHYTELCTKWLVDRLNATDVLMTTSCTHALELSLQLLELRPEDEVILPSFTYPSTANAVLMAGGKVVFSQVRGEDLTLDAKKLDEKITANTKAIIVVHYGGNVCQMDEIMSVASKYGIYVIEDAAQSFLSSYKHRYAGTIGDFGCFSFHGTKDFVAGEGGALIVNNEDFSKKAMIFRDKGTNKEAFNRGEVAYYEWVAKGSSYGPSDLLMALLYGQLQLSDEIIHARKHIYKQYADFFAAHQYDCLEGCSKASEGVEVNGHLFYMIFREVRMAENYRQFMYDHGVKAYSHFVPLHSSIFGKELRDEKTAFVIEEHLGQRLVRLPIYPDLDDQTIDRILTMTDAFMREV